MQQAQVPGWPQPRSLFRSIFTVLAFLGIASAAHAGSFADDFRPWTTTVGRDGNFYGVMLNGGVPGGYTYALTPQKRLIRLHPFPRFFFSPFVNLRGTNPEGSVGIGQDGAIYGSTRDGGVFGRGLLYKIDRFGQYRTVFHFDVGGGYKGPVLAAQNGDLFAAASEGGVLRLRKDGGHTTIPVSGQLMSLVETSNHDIILGTIPDVADPGGTLWRLNSSNQFEPFADVGYYPYCVVPLPDGSLLCIARNSLLQVSSLGAVTVIHEFALPFEGTGPVSVFVDKDGNYVGFTAGGGLEQAGVTFRIVPGANTYTVLSHLPAAGPRGFGSIWLKELFPFREAANGGNHPPYSDDDFLATTALKSVGGSLPKKDIAVLANDGDADRDPLQITDVSTPAHGTATVNPVTRHITYAAATATPENDTFTYTIADGRGGTATARVFIQTDSTARYTGDVSSLANPGTGDPGTKVGSLTIAVRANRLLSGRIDLLGRTYRFAGRFTDAGQFAAVLQSNVRFGKSTSLQLWLHPNGASWTIEATIQKNSLSFSATCPASL